MKLDFRDGSEDFTDEEKEYASYLLSGAKLNDIEAKAKFGPNLQQLRANLDIRRYVANKKIEKQNKKELINDMHIEKFVKTIPLALKVLVDSMNSQDPAIKLKAASTVAKPVLSYLDKLSVNSADAEFAIDDDGNLQFTVNVSKVNGN